MYDKSPCPICGFPLEKLTQSEAEQFLAGHRDDFEDEDVFWCFGCGYYILEEDFFFNTEE